MRRRDFLAGLVTAAAVPLAGCAPAPDEQEAVVRYQGWTGKVLYPELAEDLGLLEGVRLRWIGNTISGPQDIQAAVTGDTDVGGAFNGAVLQLAAAGAPITAVIGYYGIDAHTFGGYYVPEDSPVRTVRDLVGKTVAVNTLGGHYEAVLRMNLSRNGLSPREVDSVQLVVVPPVAAEQALRSGQLDVAVLSDMFRDKALARGGVRPVFTDYELLGSFTAGTYVLRDEFVAHHPDTARAFVAGTARAVAWAQQRPRAEVVARFRDIIRRRGRNEDTSAVEYFASTGVAATGGVIRPEEFRTWTDWLERDGRLEPGRVDPAHLYTNRLNPYAPVPPAHAVAAAPSAGAGG